MSAQIPQNSDTEPDDILGIVSPDLVDLPVIKSAGIMEVDFDGLLKVPLKLREDLKEGCGGQVWPAGMVLAKYCLRRLRDLRGKTV
jgi:hypothetical protein